MNDSLSFDSFRINEFYNNVETGIVNPQSGIVNPETGFVIAEKGIFIAETGIFNAETGHALSLRGDIRL